MNAVVYARYSSERQNEKSIEDQIKKCEEYANEHDLNIIKVYMDKAMSGKTDKRPGFQQMLKDSKNRRFKIVLCWKLDRIGRNAQDYFSNERLLENNGVKIESITEEIPEGAAGPIIKGVYVGQAESYNIGLALNVLRGMESNAKQAKSNGGQHPYGLKVDQNRDYIIDEEAAPFIRKVFDMFVKDRKSYAEIADYLNSKGQLNSRGKPFTGAYVKRMLSNSKYTGTYHFSDTVIEDAFPSIVDKDTFYKAQALLGMHNGSNRLRKKAEKFMLLGKLFCTECGKPLIATAGTSRTGSVYRYYACKTHNKKAKDCSVKNIRKDELEKFVIEVTKKHVLQDDVIEVIADYAMKLQDECAEGKLINKFKKDLKQNQKEIDTVIDLLVKGWASEELRIKLETLEERKKSLKTALSVAELERTVIDRDALIWLLKKYKEIETPDSELAKEMIDTLINGIQIDNDYITIIYNYGEKKNNTETYSLEMLQCSRSLHLVDQKLINLNFEKDFFYIQVFRSAA